MRCIITLSNNEQVNALSELCKAMGVALLVEDEPAAEAAAPGAASEPEVAEPQAQLEEEIKEDLKDIAAVTTPTTDAAGDTHAAS
jgi:hypothetical protein